MPASIARLKPSRCQLSRRTAVGLVLAALLAPPRALVTLLNELTGDLRSTETNETGAFVFAAVQPATYTVRVELSGFTTYELRNTAVPPNEQLSIGTVQ